jgi:hypothetical protein
LLVFGLVVNDERAVSLEISRIEVFRKPASVENVNLIGLIL